MNKDLTINKTVQIDADSLHVWDALTSPDKIKQYLFGTETITDWKIGNPITFQGEWEGKKYKDKGNILDFKPGKVLQYSYWSAFSGLEDKPENYSTLTFRLNNGNGQTTLALTQKGFANEQAQQHSDKSWEMVLAKLKEVAEKE